jgi:hypothetical protein
MSAAERVGSNFTMKYQFEPGQAVKVATYGGDVLERIVVTDLGRTVVVCSKAEYEAAAREKRQPEGIGVPRHDCQLLELGI